MRVFSRILTGTVAAVVVVVGLRAITQNRDLHDQLARQSAQAERATALAVRLKADTDGLERAAREARQAAQAWSNKLLQAQAQLAEERNTHEPLRQQIELMMQQEIVFKSQLEKKDAAIKSHDQGASNLRHDLEAARSLATAHADRIGQLEAEAKTRTETLTALRASLAESQKATEAAKVDLQQARERLAAAETQIAEVKRAAAQPPPAPVATNAPVSPGAN